MEEPRLVEGKPLGRREDQVVNEWNADGSAGRVELRCESEIGG